MLIVLSESLRHQDLRARPALDALVNLSTAAYEGNHLVTGSRRLFGALQQIDALGAVVTGRFKDASQLIADASALRGQVSAYVRVHPIGYTPQIELAQTASGAPQLVFDVGLDHFSESDRSRRSSLVGEDRRDAVTYMALGEAYAVKIRGFTCILEDVDGHGHKTPQAFQSLAQRSVPVLCIVDSDQADPAAPRGDTAKAALVCHEAMKDLAKIAFVHVLPCREIENLLPTALVLEALPRDPRDPHRARVLAEEGRLGKVDFADLKQLVKLKEVSARLRELSPHKRAELCFTSDSHPALLEVSGLVWSFGLAPRRGRT